MGIIKQTKQKRRNTKAGKEKERKKNPAQMFTVQSQRT